MPTQREQQERLDRVNALRARIAEQLAGSLASNPVIAEELHRQIDEHVDSLVAAEGQRPAPPDGGFGGLIGIGPDAALTLGETRVPNGVVRYDDQVNSERIAAVGDLYYIYQHEQIGVFKVVQKLKQLFEAGAVRLSSGQGAYRLYQFDRRDVLRYTRRDRLDGYRRVLGYGRGLGAGQSRPNTDFHRLFGHFVNQVTLFWRDKRISEVMRQGANDPSFGSIAVVRRAGLDLRNNLKFASFGHLNVMRIELMQVLEECFAILGSPDVMELFGADNAWDVIDEILVRYFDERLQTSPRQRMAETGRDVLRWLASGHILESNRPQFEALLNHIAEPAEEWLTSAQAMSLAPRASARSVTPWERSGASGATARRAERGPVSGSRRSTRPVPQRRGDPSARSKRPPGSRR
ncbi:hypothetical protein [Demequina mangrovi]|uniref:Uncharacterized protein n=1 Tax=Demequina mangrovi TaxID=1043493 RepID=A0A1H6UJK1_9MICO|nr:hypothetical protein [Demequina mangrovi]SEI92468.1 hypothetical protein SAMN05421637_0430 [Demequina mangrovi]